MDSLEVRAKTVEEATLRALDQLRLTRDEVEVVVVKEGRGGILGLGAEDAVIRVRALRPAPKQEPQPQLQQETAGAEQAARDVLEQLLRLMGVSGTIESRPSAAVEEPAEDEEPPVTLDITGEDLGILIGRRGQTLTALQYVVRLMVGRRTDKWVPVVIDVEGYKQRRSEALKKFAIEMADRVKVRGAPFTLEPMPPNERRIIHMALADDTRVFTESIGQGEERKVVIRPKK
jgi:spoIIIJ-associated protein